MYELQKACLKLHFSKRILVTVLARLVLWRAGSLYVAGNLHLEGSQNVSLPAGRPLV